MAQPAAFSVNQVSVEMETRKQRVRTTLHQACRDGNVDVVGSYLDKVTRNNRRQILEARDEDNQTPLHVAARFNRIRVIRKLLVKQANCKSRTKTEGLTPLHMAARFVSRESDRRLQTDSGGESEEINSIAAMQVLLQKGANLNSQDHYGMTPLHHAVQRKNIEGAMFLLSDEMIGKGININILDKTKVSPLHEAIQQRCFEIAERLVTLGADIMAEDAEGATPLHYASQEGAIDIGKLLYQAASTQGVQRQLVEKRTNENGTCLHLAVESGYDEMAELCIRMGADVNAEMNNGYTPLHMAAKQGHKPSAKLLIEGRADLEAGDVSNATPLHTAARYKQAAMVEFLLDCGANIESKDHDSFTPLLTAASYGRAKIVGILLARRADVEQTDLNGRTALHWAVKANNKNTMQVLLADDTGYGLVHMSDSRSKYPLHIAAKKGYVDLAKTLLSVGAAIDAKNDEEKTPLHLASAYGRVKVVRLLVSHDRSTINDEDEGSNMPIHLAALNGHANVIETLLEFGAQIDARNASFWTPLDCASYRGQLDVVTTLLEGDSPIDPQDKAGVTPLHLASREGHISVVKVLLLWEADVSLKDLNGFNCLDYAIEHNRIEVAEEIIKSEKWMNALASATVAEQTDGTKIADTPLRKLIRKMPDVAEVVFNQCTTSNANSQTGITQQHPNFEVQFDYRLLDDIELAKKLYHEKEKGDSDASDEESDRKSIDTLDSEMSVAQENHLSTLLATHSHVSKHHPLIIMVKSKRERLLSHPLVLSLLRHKWESFGRYVYYLNLSIFLIYLSVLTAYATTLVPPNTTSDCSGTKEGFIMFGHYFVMIFAFIRLGIIEVFQVIHLRAEYFAFGNAVANVIEWLSFSTAALFGLPLSTSSDCMVREWQWQCGIVAVFLAWFNLLVFIRKLPKIGIYIVMFLDIFKTFLQFMIVGILFVIAFGLAFYMLFTTDIAFPSPGKALVKTAVMTIGEFDYDRIFNEAPFFSYKQLSYIMWIVFLIVMPILLMNLLIGLAVDDIKDVQEHAKLQRLAMQVELVLGVEALLPSFINRRFTKEKGIVRPNDRQSIIGQIRTSIFGRTLSTDIITSVLEDESTPLERLENSTEKLQEEVGQLKCDMSKLMKQNNRLTNILKAIAHKQEVRVAMADDDDDDDDGEDEDGDDDVDGGEPQHETAAT